MSRSCECATCYEADAIAVATAQEVYWGLLCAPKFVSVTVNQPTNVPVTDFWMIAFSRAHGPIYMPPAVERFSHVLIESILQMELSRNDIAPFKSHFHTPQDQEKPQGSFQQFRIWTTSSNFVLTPGKAKQRSGLGRRVPFADARTSSCSCVLSQQVL